MPKSKGGYGFLIKWLIVLGDLIVFNLCFYLTCRWSDASLYNFFEARHRTFVLLLNFCYFFALYFVPVLLHRPVVFTDKVVQRSLSLVAMHGIFYIALLFFLQISVAEFPNDFIFKLYLLLFFVFTFWRVIAREALKKYRSRGRNYKKVIIVGAGKNGMALYREMKKEMAYGFLVYGFFDDNLQLKETLPNYLGMTHELDEFVNQNEVDEIYCTLPNSQDEKIMRIFNFAEQNMIRFYIVPEFSRYVKKRMTLDSIESVPVMAVRSEPLQSLHNQLIKRIFDIVFASLFLIFLFPFCYVILGVLIKFSSPGPVLFKQQRTGLYGKTFGCYKFRSMRVNEEANDKQAAKHDPRVTKIGYIMRKYSLDELPQFINVLKGEMSVVGPRPHMLKHTELYSTAIDKYMVRHLIRPGITGWAQVNGYRGETRTVDQMEGRVKLDVWYIENWSFLLDLKIISVTFLNMFKGDKNAY